jgi:hypothetical protein
METILKPELHRGRIAKPPRILAVRVLTREDLTKLKTESRVPARTKAMSLAHHRLARLVSTGMRNEEVCRATGFSLSRLFTLKLDPAFQQLVTGYAKRVDEAFASGVDEFYETSTSNMLRAERQLEEHLDRADDAGDLLPPKLLLAITSDRADRFGYSKKTINENRNVDVARMMEKAMARQGTATVIDARASHLPAIAPALSPENIDPQSRSPGPTPHAATAGMRRRW